VGNFAGENPGWITLLQATVGSINTYFAQLIRDVGVCNTVKMAQQAGLRAAWNHPSSNGNDLIADWHYDLTPSFTLGAAEVSPLTMAETYATFAARGVHCNVVVIDKVVRADGTEMAIPDGNCKQTVDAEVADGVSAVMNQVMYGGGAASGRVSGPWQQAGKTGTSDSAEAYWMVGFTRNAATTVAVAADNGAVDFWSNRSSKSIQGLWMPSGKQIPWDSGGTAGPIWRAVMSVVLADRPAIGFDPYSPISGSFKNLLTPTPSTLTPTPSKTNAGDPGGPGVTTTKVTSTQSTTTKPPTSSTTTPPPSTPPTPPPSTPPTPSTPPATPPPSSTPPTPGTPSTPATPGSGTPPTSP
jgi:membrane peptidoglycan carboxypeptidase